MGILVRGIIVSAVSVFFLTMSAIPQPVYADAKCATDITAAQKEVEDAAAESGKKEGASRLLEKAKTANDAGRLPEDRCRNMIRIALGIVDR